jgi:hypothetical protein
MNWYRAQRAHQLRPRCIGAVRYRTQWQINQSVNQTFNSQHKKHWCLIQQDTPLWLVLLPWWLCTHVNSLLPWWLCTHVNSLLPWWLCTHVNSLLPWWLCTHDHGDYVLMLTVCYHGDYVLMLTVSAAFIGCRHVHLLLNSTKIIAEPVAWMLILWLIMIYK